MNKTEEELDDELKDRLEGFDIELELEEGQASDIRKVNDINQIIKDMLYVFFEITEIGLKHERTPELISRIQLMWNEWFLDIYVVLREIFNRHFKEQMKMTKIHKFERYSMQEAVDIFVSIVDKIQEYYHDTLKTAGVENIEHRRINYIKI